MNKNTIKNISQSIFPYLIYTLPLSYISNSVTILSENFTYFSRVMVHFIMKILQCLPLYSDIFLPLLLDFLGINNIIFIIFAYFMRFFVKKIISPLKLLIEKLRIKSFIFYSIFYMFLFSIIFIFINITNNIIYSDSIVTTFTANDIDVTVRGTFVDSVYKKYGGNYAFTKSVTLSVSLMKLALEPDNFVPLIAGNNGPVVQQGIFTNPGNLANGRKSFRVAYELRKNPTNPNQPFEQ
jgi:hypothetical protein